MRLPLLAIALVGIPGCGLFLDTGDPSLPDVPISGMDARVDRPDARADARGDAPDGDVLVGGDVVADGPEDLGLLDADVPDATDAIDDATMLDVPNDLAGDATDAPCVEVAPPRLVAPISASVATGPLVRFSWAAASGATGYRLRVCRTRDCSSGVVLSDLAVTSTSFTAPSSMLRPGVYWWSVLVERGTCRSHRSAMWELRVAPSASAATATHWWGAFPDFNADGYADLAVGDPEALPTSGGVVRVFPGPIESATDGGATTGMPAFTSTDPRFGRVVAAAGDVNGDGFGDLVVLSNSALWLYLGSDAGLTTGAARRFPISGDVLNASAAGLGDVNGDGYGDVIFAASGLAMRSGRVVVLFGGSDAGGLTITELLAPSSCTGVFGASAAAAGDVDGDGFADILVGCPDLAATTPTDGRAFVFFGRAAGTTDFVSALLTRAPTTTGTPGTFGYLVAGVGDLDGDGRADVAVAEHDRPVTLSTVLRDPAGAVTRTTLPAPAMVSGARLVNIVGAGDIDGDGRGDYLLGYASVLGDTAALVSSRVPTMLMRRTVVALPDGAVALAGAGSLDGDDFDDVALGTASSTGGGIVQIFEGRSLTTSLEIPPTRTFTSARPRFGVALAAGR